MIEKLDALPVNFQAFPQKATTWFGLQFDPFWELDLDAPSNLSAKGEVFQLTRPRNTKRRTYIGLSLESSKVKNLNDYIAWIGHATFLIKLGNTTIITDPLFSKNTGPLIFGPKRYIEPAIKLKEIPETDLLLLTHNHYDHLDMSTLRNFPYKNTKVIIPLKLSSTNLSDASNEDCLATKLAPKACSSVIAPEGNFSIPNCLNVIGAIFLIK